MDEKSTRVNLIFRPLLYSLGWLSLGLGTLGAFLPVLPTTPFLILSAYLFSKSSPRLHRWLLELPTFGPMIRDWEENKVIRPRAKALALSVLTALIWWSILFAGLSFPLKLMQGLIWLAVGIFILTRKSR